MATLERLASDMERKLKLDANFTWWCACYSRKETTELHKKLVKAMAVVDIARDLVSKTGNQDTLFLLDKAVYDFDEA